jgi:hypothetical protein
MVEAAQEGWPLRPTLLFSDGGAFPLSEQPRQYGAIMDGEFARPYAHHRPNNGFR